VTVGTTPTLICNSNTGSALLQNLGSTAVTIGGPGVAVGAGVTLPATMASPQTVPAAGDSGGAGGGIYGVVATGSSSVAYFNPVWGG
jgi:hypothetical protein